MTSENPPPEKPLSPDEFDRREDALTEDLDDLEKRVFPEKPKPAPIGGMF